MLTIPTYTIFASYAYYRNADGTILEDYLSRCPTVSANGSFGPDNTTHGILTTGMFARPVKQPSQIDQLNSSPR